MEGPNRYKKAENNFSNKTLRFQHVCISSEKKYIYARGRWQNSINPEDNSL